MIKCSDNIHFYRSFMIHESSNVWFKSYIGLKYSLKWKKYVNRGIGKEYLVKSRVLYSYDLYVYQVYFIVIKTIQPIIL